MESPATGRITSLVNGLSAATDWADGASAFAAAFEFLSGLKIDSAADAEIARTVLVTASDKARDLFAAQLARSQDKSLSIGILALAPAFDTWKVEVPNRALWIDIANTFLARFDAVGAPLYDSLRLLAIEGVALGADEGLARFVQRVARDDVGQRFAALNISPAQLGVTLARQNWYRTGSSFLIAVISKILAEARDLGTEEFIRAAKGLQDLLAYHPDQSKPWLEFLTRHLLLPQICFAGDDADLANVALDAEWTVYMTLLKKEDTLENFASTYALLEPALAAAGRTFAATYSDALTPLPTTVPKRTTPRVAFYLTGDYTTGHAEVLYLILRGLKELPTRPIEPLVYVLSSDGKNLAHLKESVRGLNVALRHPPTPPVIRLQRLKWLRAQASADALDALVFVSIPESMCFAAALPIAPVQIWWSVKYHALQTPGLQGYLGNALFQKHPLKLADHWKFGDSALPFGTDNSLKQEARKLRHQYDPDGSKVVLGCFARAERLLDISYTQMLGRLMRAYPSTVFLWTGRNQPAELVTRFREEGIAERCHFVGWVNIKLYAHVIDIKLDSFPFPSGIAAAEVMSASRPVVILVTTLSLESSLAGSLSPLFEGEIGTSADRQKLRKCFGGDDAESAFPLVHTIDAYERFASKLIDDLAFRSRVGKGCRDAVMTFLRDESRAAATTAAKIIEIINEVRPAS